MYSAQGLAKPNAGPAQNWLENKKYIRTLPKNIFMLKCYIIRVVYVSINDIEKINIDWNKSYVICQPSGLPVQYTVYVGTYIIV